MPLAFHVGGIAVQGDIERKSWGHVETDTGGWIPHLTRVTSPTTNLEVGEAVFVAGVERVAAESLTCFRNRRPAVGVVSDITAIVHGKVDARFSDRHRNRLDKR